MILTAILLSTILGAASAPHARASLVSEQLSVPASGTTTLALRLEMDPDWHVYWRNPGAAGLPPRIEWLSPSSVHPDSIQWPVPGTIPVPPLMTYGYHDSVTFPFEVRIDRSTGDSLRLRAIAHWQICKELCLLEKQEVSLTLPISRDSASVDPRWVELFERARAATPLALDPSRVRAALGESLLVVTLSGLDVPPGSRIFPITSGVVDDAAEQATTPLLSVPGFPGTWRAILHRDPFLLSQSPDSLGFVLVAPGPITESGTATTLGSAIESRVSLQPLDSSDISERHVLSASTDAPRSSSGTSLLLALVWALLGGLLLNLMPCVLPVLSLKILDMLRSAGHDRKVALSHGAAYAAGVVGSFVALAAVLLILRSGGSALGWGFQLQSPPVVAILSGLMLLVACNLWGVFEPGAGLAALAGSNKATGWIGSFFTGLTATIVATPCTAPFMGAALGYTLLRPAAETLLVFAFLGIGLAAPVVAITAIPSLGKLLPKPGAWMETLKQGLGFAMAATAAWLGWLLARLSGTEGLAYLFAHWLLVGLAVWILGRWAVPHRGSATRWISRLIALALLALAISLALQTRPADLSHRAVAIGEESWHPGLTSELRASGKPWFLHFTADWCLSCQVNERNAFADSRVEEAFRSKGIRRVKADWTARDTAIARELERFGRQGIPFYVLSDGTRETFLPEVVTPGIVLEALDRVH